MSSLNLLITPRLFKEKETSVHKGVSGTLHSFYCNGWVTDGRTDGCYQNVYLISLKMNTLVVQKKKMCIISEFSDLAQKKMLKIHFKFEIWEKIYKRFSCKKNVSWEFFIK